MQVLSREQRGPVGAAHVVRVAHLRGDHREELLLRGATRRLPGLPPPLPFLSTPRAQETWTAQGAPAASHEAAAAAPLATRGSARPLNAAAADRMASEEARSCATMRSVVLGSMLLRRESPAVPQPGCLCLRAEPNSSFAGRVRQRGAAGSRNARGENRENEEDRECKGKRKGNGEGKGEGMGEGRRRARARARGENG